MPNIITNHVWCPLCEKEMTIMQVRYGMMRTLAYVCQPCNVFTFPFDPAFNKWRDADKKIPCPSCQHEEVKWFLRYVDQYMKFLCPKCGIKGEGDCNAVIEENGALDLEIMENSVQKPEETRIEIPVDKLKIPQEEKQRLKKKIRENRRRR